MWLELWIAVISVSKLSSLVDVQIDNKYLDIQ